jgi:hypothetical protein
MTSASIAELKAEAIQPSAFTAARLIQDFRRIRSVPSRFLLAETAPPNIENREVGVAASDEVVHECGLAGADINDGGRWSSTCLLDQCEGSLEVRAIPAHLIRRLLRANLVPMRLRIHQSD